MADHAQCVSKINGKGINTMLDQIQRLKKARSQLLVSASFFGTLAMHLEITATDVIETMATDGSYLCVNEKFAATLTDPEMRGVLAHEVLHCANSHFSRRGSRDHQVFNMATDYAINRDLIDLKFTLPSCRLYDAKYDGMTAEAIYATLIKDPANKSARGWSIGDVIEPKDAPNAPKEALCAEWQGRVLLAAKVLEKGQGALPASLQSLIDAIRNPVLSWREILARFVSDSCQRDYSWRKPNRKHIVGGLYLPSMVSDGRNHVLVAVDTSGSIETREFESFMAEIQSLLDGNHCDKITVLHCDTKINHVAEYETGEVISRQIYGGGGTKFSPVMGWIEENQSDAVCLIYFTDMECSDFGDEPAMSVLWANTDIKNTAQHAKRIPFGKIVEINI
jgi:predicted metal-dependent peptidase